MAKRKNKLSRDRRGLVDFLNFDFSIYPKRAAPSMPLGLFLERYGLDTEAGYETASQIQDELREILFLKAPDGKRELGPLVTEARKYPTRTVLVPLEDNKGVETWPLSPENPREDLYGIIISAVSDKTFPSLQKDCKNCHRCYWRKSDFCSLACGREWNDKDAVNRMRRYRLKQRRKRGGK